MFPKWSDYNIEYTTKGLFKNRVFKLLKALTLAATIIGAFYIRKDPVGGLMTLRNLARGNIRDGMFAILGLMESGAKWIGG